MQIFLPFLTFYHRSCEDELVRQSSSKMSSTRGQHVVQRVVGVVDWCYVTTWMDCEESSGESYLFSKEWSGEQELELLCAIEQHGYGNWCVC